MDTSLHTLPEAYALIAELLADPATPGHIGDHLTSALLELESLVDGLPQHPPPLDQQLDPAGLLGDLRVYLLAKVRESVGVARILALGRCARELALAERELLGEPCPTLSATRDRIGALAEISR